MRWPRWGWVVGGFSLLVFCGLVVGQDGQLSIEHPECSYFGPQRDKFAAAGLKAQGVQWSRARALSSLTEQAIRMRSAEGFEPPRGSTHHPIGESFPAGSIDAYIFSDLRTNGITPAPRTTDWEFIRRVTLDLTGRIPSPAQVLSFVNDTTPDKRSRLIDQLLASPEWVDKWTMYFGDLYQNSVTKPSTGLNRFVQGRNAFYQWIHDSLANGKPYNQMASELIATAGGNSYSDGTTNWALGGWVSNGPVQDTTDQITANVADTFLGIAHVNCLLCHNGRGHLDTLSLWATGTTRYQAWQLASFFSHTQLARTTISSNVYYWTLADNTRGYTNDYTLNTTSGNRPARTAPTGCKSGQPCYYVPPMYIFTGSAPTAGSDYRAALAKDVTGDFQFARALVNYMWAEFLGMGMVDPPDTFDPARLDPDNPPPSPWTLQASNPRLLNGLATHFVESGFNVKALMREIVNSQTYQLSSRYEGQWNEAWNQYFARKFVRRLWGEEIHDALVVSSGIVPSYTVTGFSDQGFTPVSYAMKLPDVVNVPNNGRGNVSTFLDTFLRGNRDDQPRKGEGSILQALNQMNNSFVEGFLLTSGASASPLITKNLTLNNTDLVNTLYLSILSRYPSGAELAKSQTALSSGNRTQAVQDLVWSLYNKVDFLFNY